MGKKSRLKRERRESKKLTNTEGNTMKEPKSRGIVIEGGSDNHAWGNTVVGFDEGVVIKDSPRSTANRNTVVSKESASIVTEIQTFISTLNENIQKLELSDDQKKEVQSDIHAIEAQIESPKPKASIIAPCFESIKRILESAAGSAIGASLVANADKILALLAA
ncbi:hypothetical protein [Pseudoalteromonas gelatinilytica]|uniref:Uncharacterized protein n=1 Tax=Pseudoalteromonas gelatinilytica TaxID=1703256 RepID=A0ABQ1TAR0_9GAMM|nr:hypothetical protein [Pseudoalteromonas profundi]GGE88674.1 hypothetical protein GCM10008027_11980 [Pseudoalteromonas profundi]